MMVNIVLVEDEMLVRRSIRRHLEHAGHHVADTDSIASALALMREVEADALITDISLGNENGLDLIHQLRGDGFDGGIIIITAHGSVNGAVRGIKLGADEYLQKPISLEELQRLLVRTIEDRAARRRLSLYRRIENVLATPAPLLGSDERWNMTMERARRLTKLPVSPTSEITSILIAGETGVGKRSLGRSIHSLSSSSSNPFVHIRCFALPATVLEGELFGYDPGSSQDSARVKPGIFELAAGGTVFFEEIAEMPLPLQSKLLAVVEQGIAVRLGGNRQVRLHVRIIASTSQDLEARVAEGSFRADLFYRLNELSLTVPPLRERGNDVRLLAESFLTDVAREFGRPQLRFSSTALDAICSHRWPGNVRELKNVVRRAAVLAMNDQISPDDLGIRTVGIRQAAGALERADDASQPAVVCGGRDIRFDFDKGPIRLDEIEKQLIIAAIKSSGGNISKASRLIGMTRSSLRYRIDRHQLGIQVSENDLS